MPVKNSALDLIWKEHPEYVIEYWEAKKTFEMICDEVKSILISKIDEKGIETTYVLSQVMTLLSYCEEIQRNCYKSPFTEMTGLAVVRIVVPFSSEIQSLVKIISNCFEIAEAHNKNKLEEDDFGYSALNFLVKFCSDDSGTKYDDLNNRICEIQIRTILQDAWEHISHHLAYKQELDVSPNLRRNLVILLRQLGAVDDHLEILRDRKKTFQTEFKDTFCDDRFLKKQKADLDSLTAVIDRKYPERKKNDG